MIKNLSEYFLQEQEFYLYKITYDRIDSIISEKEMFINCTDNITAEINENNEIRIIVTRSLNFDPEKMFRLSVAFGADLRFDPKKINEYNWREIDLADEFRENGDFVTGNLMSRITLLIAQITSSFGQPPLVLAPSVTKIKEET